jgi:hypothetical protein
VFFVLFAAKYLESKSLAAWIHAIILSIDESESRAVLIATEGTKSTKDKLILCLLCLLWLKKIL